MRLPTWADSGRVASEWSLATADGDMRNVTQWLERLGFGQYADLFVDNDVDEEVLVALSEDDLVQLGVTSLGHRKKLLKAIAAAVATGFDTGRPSAGSPAEVTSPRAAPVTSAERRQLTVMFCDLVGSTQLSQRLDPEDLREVITACQRAWKTEIERYGGFVARYMGDGVLAYFGFPQAHEDDAERAIHVGLGLVASMVDVNAGLTQSNLDLAVRVGVATGPVVVGDLVGEGGSKENPAVGETPNLAARLQTIAAPDSVVISDLSRQLAGESFQFEDLGLRQARGIEDPVHVWRVRGRRPTASRFEAGHPGRLTPLVGREHELDLLLERWHQAKAGEGQVVVLSGEAGIGKSRVSQTLQLRLTRDEHVRVGFQCSPHHNNSALYPFVTRIEADAGFEVGDTPKSRIQKLEGLFDALPSAVDRAVPLMAALLSVPTDDRYPAVDLSTRRNKEEMLRMLAARLGELGRGKPLLVLFEDAHWADATSLELLEIVIEQTQRLPVLLLVTARPEFESPWTAHTHVTSLTLNRFSRQLVTSMVQSIVCSVSLPGEIMTQIIARSDGNPLFVEELTRSVLESGVATGVGGNDPAQVDPAALSIPASLNDSLMARLDRVPVAREVAQCAAVIGREFSRDFLADIPSLGGQDLAAALDQLVDAEVVFRRGPAAAGLFNFKHALVRDAAYESLLKRRRRQLHLEIGNLLRDRLQQGATVELELIAHHYTQACAYPDAVDYWQRAGTQAIRKSANREAVAHFRRGIGLLGQLADTRETHLQELAMQVALGSVLETTEGFAAPPVGQTHQRAQQLCEELGDNRQLSRVLYGLAHFHMVRGELTTACRLGERCLGLADELDDPGYLVDARLVLGGSLGCCGRLESARAHLEGGLAQSGAGRDAAAADRLAMDTDVFGRSFLGHVLWLLGFPSQAQDQLKQAVSIAAAQSDPFTSARAWAYTTMLCQYMRDVDATMESASKTIAICYEHHFEYYHAWGELMRAWADDQLAGSESTTTGIENALDRLLRTGAGLRRSYYLGLLAQSLGAREKSAAGLRLIDQALEDVASTGERWAEPELYRARGQLLLQAGGGSANEAEQWLRQALQCARSQKALSLQLRATVALAQFLCDRGEGAQAREILVDCCSQITEGMDTVDMNEAQAQIDALTHRA